jgi:hypothetical protein
MTTIATKAGFDWNKVAWSKPDSVRAQTCSHIECLAIIPADSVPLMMWRPDGHCAQFCDKCMVKWWGMVR